jgi:molybdate transport repressor ModE-like protein
LPRKQSRAVAARATRPARPPRLGVKAKFWLTLGDGTLFGDGKAALLEAVDQHGSLRQAAASMEMSYRHAWGLLRELDEAAGFAFLEHSGAGSRTTLRLTERGRQFIAAYRQFRAPLQGIVDREFRKVFPS